MNEIKLPHSEEAENILLNCCLLSPDGAVFDEISSAIKEENFYNANNRKIFSCMQAISAKSVPIDELSLSEELKKRNEFDDIGGMSGILGLTKYVETTVQAKTSALIIRDNANKRDLIRSSRLAIESIHNGADIQDSLKVLEDGMNAIGSHETQSTELGKNAQGFIDKVSALRNGTYKSDALPTGIPHLDDKLHEGGIGKGEVFIIAAPTSCGKSQLALSIAARASIQKSLNCVIFSFEMPQDQVMKRIVQMSACVNISSANKLVGKDRDKAFDRIESSVANVQNSDLHVISYVRDMTDFRSKCRNINRKKKIDLLIIDYLQLIPWNKKLSKCDGIAEVSHAIKQIAIELNTRVIMLAQINRDGARSGSPDIHALKDSGDVENDADVILMMHPENNDMNNAKRVDTKGNNYIELNYKIVKNREGERDVGGKFAFLNEVGRFT